MSRIISVRAPSNIALIKYMGKSDAASNLPMNASLSMTLDSLCTVAELCYPGDEGPARWSSETPQNLPSGISEPRVPMLTDSGQERVLRHFERVRVAVAEIFAYEGLKLRNGYASEACVLHSANTFPPSSGIASSASSFAAITLAAALGCADDPEEFQKKFEKASLKRALARVSRMGSGSSCRSFEGPWVLWEEGDAAAVATRMPEMAHFVILISSEPKRVSSSDAHHMVRTSPLWEGRVDRVGARIKLLLSALSEGDLRTVARVAWTEAWEMHSLFHTCASPFSYWEPGSIEALQFLSPYIEQDKPPIVTLDAGPNVHVIVPTSARSEWKTRLRERFGDRVILEDAHGSGARVVHVE